MFYRYATIRLPLIFATFFLRLERPDGASTMRRRIIARRCRAHCFVILALLPSLYALFFRPFSPPAPFCAVRRALSLMLRV